MPPKPKVTRQEVAQAAFSIIKNEGLSALTARDLGTRLGTSARPIFTVFKGMDEVRLAARELAMAEFKEQISDFRDYTPAFKRIGMMIVSYGIREPELFRLLFIPEHSDVQDFQSSMRGLGDISDVCIDLIERNYMMTPHEAVLLFEQMWMQAVGLGAMCAAGIYHPCETEIEQRLSLAFASLTMFIKTGKLEQVFPMPEKSASDLFRTPRSSDISYNE